MVDIIKQHRPGKETEEVAGEKHFGFHRVRSARRGRRSVGQRHQHLDRAGERARDVQVLHRDFHLGLRRAGSSNPVAVNSSTSTRFWCTKGVTTDLITADMGLNPAGAIRQMRDSVGTDLILFADPHARGWRQRRPCLAPHAEHRGLRPAADYTSGRRKLLGHRHAFDHSITTHALGCPAGNHLRRGAANRPPRVVPSAGKGIDAEFRPPLCLFVLSLLAWAGTAAFGDTGTLAVTAIVLSKSVCKFDEGVHPRFGPLDPARRGRVDTTASVGYSLPGSAPRSRSSSRTITDRTRPAPAPAGCAPPLRRSSSRAASPSSPASGTIEKRPGTLALSGTVRWVDFRGSMAGANTKSVIVSILP